MFFLYTIFISILVVAGFSLLYIYKSPKNYFLAVRLYNVIEYSILAYLFYLCIKNKSVKKTLAFSLIPFFLFCIYDFITAKEATLAFLPLIIEYFVLLLFIVYFFFEVMQEMVVEPIYTKAIFWISVAFIVNFSGNFFLFLYSKSSYNNEAFKTQYTIIYTTVTIVKNLLLCISIFINDENASINNKGFSEINLDTMHPIKNQN